jgi:hypothetical protein
MTERRRKKYEKTLLCLSRNHYFFCKIYCALCMPFFVIFVLKNIASMILLLIFNQHKITCQQCIFSDQSDQSIRPPHQSQLLDISYYNVFLI